MIRAAIIDCAFIALALAAFCAIAHFTIEPRNQFWKAEIAAND